MSLFCEPDPEFTESLSDRNFGLRPPLTLTEAKARLDEIRADIRRSREANP